MNRYKTPIALRRALEDRLMAAVRREGGDIQRMRRQAAFDRLLCRLFHKPDAPWLLKGGYAMELRIRAARTTRDVDLAIRNLPAKKWDDAAIRSLLESAASIDLQDGFEFTIGAPTMDLDAAPYGGSRFPVEAQMAGRRFASFHLDVSAGDVLREPFEILEGQDWLGFAGIATATAGPTVTPSKDDEYSDLARLQVEHLAQWQNGSFTPKIRSSWNQLPLMWNHLPTRLFSGIGEVAANGTI